MKRLGLSVTGLIGALFALSPLMPPAAWAGVDDSSRDGRFELYLPVTYIASESFGSEGGTSVDLHSDYSLGVGFNYNFNEYFALGFEFTGMSANYEARVHADDPNDSFVEVGGSLDSSSIQVSGQYNILQKTVTPYVRGGIGSTYIDSNIPTAPPIGSCWWHPWLGYICGAWQPTSSDSFFSYGLAVGVRAELTETFYIDFGFNQLWLDWSVADNATFDAYRLKFGWMF